MEVHHPIGRGSLFAKVVFDAPLFFCPVWLEKSPEQVIRDLATYEKEQQTFPMGLIGISGEVVLPTTFNFDEDDTRSPKAVRKKNLPDFSVALKPHVRVRRLAEFRMVIHRIGRVLFVAAALHNEGDEGEK